MPQTSETFNINKSRRYVGFEIEGYSDEFDYMEEGVPNDLGECVDDCSIDPDYGYAFEFRSDPKNGDELLQYIKKVGRWLDSIDAGANYSCGLHVHLDMSNDTDVERRRIKNWWFVFQNLMYSFVDPSRYDAEYAPKVYNMQYWGADRYGLNISAIRRHGTYEVRIHHGTTDVGEITNWVKLLISFFDTFKHIPCPAAKREQMKTLTRDELIEFFWLQLDVPEPLQKFYKNRTITWEKCGYSIKEGK